MRVSLEGKEYDVPGCSNLGEYDQQKVGQTVKQIVCLNRYQCKWLGDCFLGVKKPEEVLMADTLTTTMEGGLSSRG